MLKSTIQTLILAFGLAPVASIAKASSHGCHCEACDCDSCECGECDSCPCEE